MSDSSYTSVSRHRSALSSSTLCGSAGFGPSGGGHAFCPPGRGSNLDLIDDAWCKATLQHSAIDAHVEHLLPPSLTEGADISRAGGLPDQSSRGGAASSSIERGDVGPQDVPRGFNRFAHGGVYATGEMQGGGSGWGGLGPRGTEDVERWEGGSVLDSFEPGN
ncbi:hypothetical protein TeGR_g1371 [Tetraparma gracilis]|uniref:Uncharacterized protein n=1 Tax=Tetraparma gracilis TaxID=2962635 RepID=A0ABQ6N9Q1_9STRA|nr:hypothetical protein TeGR_g1371 [Tetraparma gracilis]